MKHLVVGIVAGTVIGAALSCSKGKKLMSVIGCKVKEEVDRRFKEAEKAVKEIDLTGSDTEEQTAPQDAAASSQPKQTPVKRTSVSQS